MKEKRATKAVMQAVDKLYDHLPAFVDIFDEDSFYLFAGAFTLFTFLATFVASRYITLKQRD